MEHDHKLRLMHCVALVILALVLAGCGAGSSRSNRSLVQITGILEVYDDQLGTIGAASATSRDSLGQRGSSRSYSSSPSIASAFNDLSLEVPREWIVGVYPGVTLDDLRAWLASFGVVPLREIYGADAYVVEVPTGHPDPEGLMDRVLMEISELVYAEPNWPMRTLAGVKPNDDYFKEQWNLIAVHLPEAWEEVRKRTAFSPPVRIAIVDTGVCREHEDLDDDELWDGPASMRASSPFNPFICDFSSFAVDERHHGTRVASVLAAITNNHKGMAGAFWDPAGNASIQLVSARVFDERGQATIERVAGAINRLVQDPEPPDIINISLGLREKIDSQALRNAIQGAYNAGILIVAAAGNDERFVTYPAAYREVLAVGATNRYDDRASWSGRGSELDLMAPGVDVLVAMGRSDYRAGEWGNGTSFAAPLVSGIAALIMASGVQDAQEVRDLLLYTARSVPDRFDKTQGHSTEYGWGLIDAAAALRLGAAPKVFLARRTDERLIRVAASVQLAPNGAFRIEPEPQDEDLWVVGWVDVDRDRAVSSGDFFVQRQVRPTAGQPITLGTLTAEPYVGPRIPVELH